jgi:hypothetical protein
MSDEDFEDGVDYFYRPKIKNTFSDSVDDE